MSSLPAAFSPQVWQKNVKVFSLLSEIFADVKTTWVDREREIVRQPSKHQLHTWVKIWPESESWHYTIEWKAQLIFVICSPRILLGLICVYIKNTFCWKRFTLCPPTCLSFPLEFIFLKSRISPHSLFVVSTTDLKYQKYWHIMGIKDSHLTANFTLICE